MYFATITIVVKDQIQIMTLLQFFCKNLKLSRRKMLKDIENKETL